MKIGFDGRYAEGDLVGVGKYIRSLVLELSKRGIECVIFYSHKPKFEIKGTNIKSVILNSPNRYIFEQILLPIALTKEKVDLYHAPGNVGVPLLCPVPAILTVHDIIPLQIKNYFSYSPIPFLSKLSYLLRLRTSLIKARIIATDSNFVKNELIKKFHIDPNKINTIYLGSPDIYSGGILPKELVGQKYILNNGGIDIRKNQEGLIRAFKKYLDYNESDENTRLVITGENTRIKEILMHLVSKLELTDSVIFTGYVDDKTLGAIIKSAKLVCYPTLSEGFGFPILEAFSYGIPVISSNVSSIPEVVGDAAILVDPNNEKEIADAIAIVLKDNKITTELKRKGLEQVKKFSWVKTVNEYLNLYNHV